MSFRHLHYIAISAIIFFSSFFAAAPAAADINVSGDWIGTLDLGSGPQPFSFNLVQDGSAINGVHPGDTDQGVITGAITGNQLTFQSYAFFPNYTIYFAVTTDGLTLSGPISDSNALTGTITATRQGSLTQALPLTLGTTLVLAPSVAVTDNTATITLQKFKKPRFPKKLSYNSRAATVLAAVQYVVSIKGPSRARIISSRNVVSARNLKPGNYTVSYRVNALKNGKKAFSTTVSPAASFEIRP